MGLGQLLVPRPLSLRGLGAGAAPGRAPAMLELGEQPQWERLELLEGCLASPNPAGTPRTGGHAGSARVRGAGVAARGQHPAPPGTTGLCGTTVPSPAPHLSPGLPVPHRAAGSPLALPFSSPNAMDPAPPARGNLVSAPRVLTRAGQPQIPSLSPHSSGDPRSPRCHQLG